MKTLKILVILAASAMLLGLTQCKKKVETITPVVKGGVPITVTVNNNDKHTIITGEGADQGKVFFNSGDELYVGNGGQFVGTLVYDGEKFVGNIGVDDEPPYEPIPLTTEDKLHFYYLGGVEPGRMAYENGEIYAYFNISNQKDNLPVFSYGCTSGNYDSEVNTYSCFLYNKCALVKFNIPATSATSDDVIVFGMCTEVKVTFANLDENVFVPTGQRGQITLNSRGDNNYEKWGILLPQDKVDDAMVAVGTKLYENAVDVPAIHNNDLHKLTVDMSNEIPYEPLYSVGANKKVEFAPGNLQYKALTDTWRFGENQYQYVGGSGDNDVHYGNVTGSSNDNPSATYDGWIDLFLWGASGWYNLDRDPLSVLFRPWDVRENLSSYGVTTNDNNIYGIGPSLDNPVSPDIAGTKYDWGVYNAIYNPSTLSTDLADTWRTPTEPEMRYLMEERPGASSLYGKGRIGDVWGLILLPDIWLAPQGLTFDPNDENTYTVDQWARMEAQGALFFPCAGSLRDKGEHFGSSEAVGCYWLANHYEGGRAVKDSYGPSENVYALYFEFEGINSKDDQGDTYIGVREERRYCRSSVRLVKDVQ